MEQTPLTDTGSVLSLPGICLSTSGITAHVTECLLTSVFLFCKVKTEVQESSKQPVRKRLLEAQH